jgi:hypothetical protein
MMPAANSTTATIERSVDGEMMGALPDFFERDRLREVLDRLVAMT